jgi:hypothetical protein
MKCATDASVRLYNNWLQPRRTIFISTNMSISALEINLSSYPMDPEASVLGVQWSEHEVGHSLLCTTVSRDVDLTFTSQCVFIAWYLRTIMTFLHYYHIPISSTSQLPTILQYVFK